MALTITVNGVPYPVPSSGSDQNWAAQQVAFLQALAAATNTAIADAAAATAAAAAATAAAAAATAATAALQAAVQPSDVEGSAGVGSSPSTKYGRHVVHQITVNYTDVSDPSDTKTITFWQVPPKTRVLRVLAWVTDAFASGSLVSFDIQVGNPLSSDDDYLLDFSGTIAPNIRGAAQADLGAGVVGGTGFDADLRGWDSTTDCTATFHIVGDTLDALTAGSVTFFVECCTFPP